MFYLPNTCPPDAELERFFLLDIDRYYGDTLAETVLGKALKTMPIPRESYVVSTKCGRYGSGFDFSAGRVTRSVDESLARLNLQYVDIILCHDIEFGSLDQIVNETIPALQKLKESGKIRHIGISGLPLNIFKCVHSHDNCYRRNSSASLDTMISRNSFYAGTYWTESPKDL